MILKTRYNLPAPTTSPRTVQPDGVMRGHRDGENSPQERPRPSEEKEEVVVNVNPSTDEGEFFFPKSRSRRTTNQHNSPIVVPNWRYFGNKGQSTDGGGEYHIQEDFVENTNNTVTAARVAAHEEAAIGKHRQEAASTDENKQYDTGGTGDNSLISA